MNEKKIDICSTILSLEGCPQQVKAKVDFKKKFQDGVSSPKMIKSENPKPSKTENK
ncbi:hypothetical protein ACMXEJ_001665 [Campylobacter jejuni]